MKKSQSQQVRMEGENNDHAAQHRNKRLKVIGNVNVFKEKATNPPPFQKATEDRNMVNEVISQVWCL